MAFRVCSAIVSIFDAAALHALAGIFKARPRSVLTSELALKRLLAGSQLRGVLELV